jgi:hypothetical protein
VFTVHFHLALIVVIRVSGLKSGKV